jgi:hypothetical protein
MLTVPVELNVSIGTFETWDIEMLWMYLIVSNVSGMSGIIQLFQLLGRHIRHNRLSFHSRTSRGFCQPDGGQASKLYREYTFYKRNMQGMGKMDSPLPASIQPLLDAYLDAIEPLRAHFYGIYIYGSIALGAFEELASDIDLSPETLPPPGEKNLSRRMSDLRDDT